MSEYVEKNKDKITQVEHDGYMSKINLALQLIRITINGNPTNISQSKVEDRILLFAKTPEDQIRLYSKYLSIFANITAKAFASEEILKNS